MPTANNIPQRFKYFRAVVFHNPSLNPLTNNPTARSLIRVA
ncbi:MAG: hypothetical protein AB3A66_15280 [Nodularia sp. CChRGM 3473]